MNFEEWWEEEIKYSLTAREVLEQSPWYHVAIRAFTAGAKSAVPPPTYAQGQEEMRERAALSVSCRIIRYRESARDRAVNDKLAMCAEAIRALPIKEGGE